MTELETLTAILEVLTSILTLGQFAIGFVYAVWMILCVLFVWRRFTG